MTVDCGRSWDRPFYWWGLPWTQPNPRTIDELVGQGMLAASQAAWLLDHVRRGGSVVVAARASGAGKSTLAYALAEKITSKRTGIYVRGAYESFDWLDAAAPESTTLLVNEMSPHLPTYCWGECARTVLRLVTMGCQLITTLHADSSDDLCALLQTAPIHATDEQVVAFNVVVFLDSAAPTSGRRRRVTSIVRLRLDRTSGLIEAAPARI